MVKRKQFRIGVLLLLLALLGSSCRPAGKAPDNTANSGEDTAHPETETATISDEERELEMLKSSLNLSGYDPELYITPVWEGNTVYQELFVLYEDADGNTVIPSFLYRPERIISIRNASLTAEYAQGTDYLLGEDGRLVLPEGSNLPVMPRTAYVRAEDTTTNPQYPEGGAIRNDRTVVQKYYLSVTYRHAGTFSGRVPENRIATLPRTAGKLRNKETLRITFVGDSITCGFWASGVNTTTVNYYGKQVSIVGNAAPYAPTYTDQTVGQLRRAYGYEDIIATNVAVGGTSTGRLPNDTRAEEQIAEGAPSTDLFDRVRASEPDLIVCAYGGMNEYWSPAKQYGERITDLLTRLHEENPDAEFCLVSSMYPNMLAYSWGNNNLAAFEDELIRIAESFDAAPVAVATVNGLCKAGLDAGKSPLDFVTDNQNHPNDFTIRLYAQAICKTLGALENFS